MDGSPSSIIMIGIGNGTFNGSPSLILTMGYGTAPTDVIVFRGTLTVNPIRGTLTVNSNRDARIVNPDA